MKISISIMAHPSRAEMVEYIKERLGNIPVSFDKGQGIWENCKAAWRLHDPKAEWHIVVQDDAIICNDFIKKAIEVLEIAEKKGCAASLFFGKRLLLKETAKQGMKTGFIIRKMLHWGLAICLPVRLIEEMIAFGDKMNIQQDDARISYFLQSKKIPIYYPMPSLVDHRIGKSLVNDPGENRTAYKYIDGI